MVKKWGVGIERESNPVTVSGFDTVASGHSDTIADAAAVGGRRNPRNGDRIVTVNGVNGVAIGSIHHDVTVRGYELQSSESGGSDWKNKSIKRAVKDLRFVEKKVVEQLQHRNRRSIIYPFGTIGNSVENSNHGSYHISLTLPYDTGDPPITHKRKTGEFFRQVQWIEPLLVAKVGAPRMNSINDSGSETEGTERGTVNSYGSTLTTDFNYLLNNDDEGTRTGANAEYWRKYVKLSQINRNSTSADFRTRGSRDQRFGVEVRFTDTFDSRFVGDYMKVFALLSQNEGAEEGKKVLTLSGCEVSDFDQDAAKAMARVLEEGYNAYLPKEYLKKVNHELKLDLSEAELNNVRAKDFANIVFHKIWEKNKDKEDAKLFCGETVIEEPKVFDVNEAAFDYFYRRKLNVEQGFRGKNFDVLKGLLLLDLGEEKEVSAGNDGLKKIIEDRIGVSMSAEDTRDFVEFYERRGFFIVKRDEDGKVVSVKVNYNAADVESDDPAVNKFYALTQDTSFYSGKAPEPSFENYETDAVLLEGVARRAVEEPTVVPTTRGTLRPVSSSSERLRRTMARWALIRIGDRNHNTLVNKMSEQHQALMSLRASIGTVMARVMSNNYWHNQYRMLQNEVIAVDDRTQSVTWTTTPYTQLATIYWEGYNKLRRLNAKFTRLNAATANIGRSAKNRPVRVRSYKR